MIYCILHIVHILEQSVQLCKLPQYLYKDIFLDWISKGSQDKDISCYWTSNRSQDTDICVLVDTRRITGQIKDILLKRLIVDQLVDDILPENCLEVYKPLPMEPSGQYEIRLLETESELRLKELEAQQRKEELDAQKEEPEAQKYEKELELKHERLYVSIRTKCLPNCT